MPKKKKTTKTAKSATAKKKAKAEWINGSECADAGARLKREG